MSALETTALSLLQTLVSSVWPAVGTLIPETQLNRQNWESQVTSGQLVVPFAVVRLEPGIDSDWGFDNLAFQLPVVLTFVVAAHVSPDPVTYLLQQCDVVRTALATSDQLQLVGEVPAVNVNSEGGASRIFYNLQTGLQAAEMRFSLLVGTNLSAS